MNSTASLVHCSRIWPCMSLGAGLTHTPFTPFPFRNARWFCALRTPPTLRSKIWFEFAMIPELWVYLKLIWKYRLKAWTRTDRETDKEGIGRCDFGIDMMIQNGMRKKIIVVNSTAIEGLVMEEQHNAWCQVTTRSLPGWSHQVTQYPVTQHDWVFVCHWLGHFLSTWVPFRKLTFSLSIVRCSSRHQPALQVAILKVDVIPGRIIPSMLADYFGT